MNYMGIDFHKHFIHFAILNQSGKVLKRVRIPSEREAITDFVEKVPRPVKAAIEATRNWYWIYNTIEPLVEELKLASPAKIRIIAESTVKTDKIDAKVIDESCWQQMAAVGLCGGGTYRTEEKSEVF